MKSIQILPREPLTRKALAAINKFVNLKGEKKGFYAFVLIQACLKAERMRRRDLYALLEKQGCAWRNGYWINTKVTKERNNG